MHEIKTETDTTVFPGAELPYRPAVAPLRYARHDRVRLRFMGTGYDATVTAAFVTGTNEIVTTYVVTLDGCDGCVTVTDHKLLSLLRSGAEADG